MSNKPATAPVPKDADMKYWRWIMIGATGIFYITLVAYPRAMELAGIPHYGVWFLDTYAILAALDALRAGLNPFVANPLNYFGGTHVYSSWWFGLEHTGLTRADSSAAGGIVLALAALATLRCLRPRLGYETAWALGVLCSAPVVLGVNRANMDLLIFALLTPVVPAMRAGNRWVRLIVPASLIALAAGLKYYPAVLGLILCGVATTAERKRVVAAGMLLIGLATLTVASELTRYGGDPLPAGLYTFGAPVALQKLGCPVTWAWWIFPLVAVGPVVAFVRALQNEKWNAPTPARVDYLRFLCGAILLTACFVFTVNYAYRWIYAVWIMPFLWHSDEAELPQFARRSLTAVRWLLLFALWTDLPVAVMLNLQGTAPETAEHWSTFWHLLQQPLLWVLFVMLSCWVTHFVWQNLSELIRPDVHKPPGACSG